MTPHQLAKFNKRSYSIYAGARKKARDKSGIQSMELSFTLGFFRVALEGVIERKVPCAYCGERVTLATATLDHKVPPDRAGESLAIIDRLCDSSKATDALHNSFDWPNMRICHIKCNRRKGLLTDFEFRELLDTIEKFPPVAKAEVLKKLSSVPFRWFDNKHKKDKPKPAQLVEDF